MFYICLFLLSLFLSVEAMDIVEHSDTGKDWVSLRALARHEGYCKAKGRGDTFEINRSAADIALFLDKKYKHGDFPSELYSYIGSLVKQDHYAKTPIYKARRDSFKDGHSTGVESLCVDEANNRLYMLSFDADVVVSDIETKKMVMKIISPVNRGEFKSVNINGAGTLFVRGDNKLFTCEASSGEVIGSNEGATLLMEKNELRAKDRWSGLYFNIFRGDRLDVSDAEGNSLAPIDFAAIPDLWKPRAVAVNQKNGDVYVASNDDSVHIFGPVINYQKTMKELSPLLLLSAVTHVSGYQKIFRWMYYSLV